MRRYTELLAALALSTGMALHAQTNEMVIQTKKTSIMLPMADFMPNW